MKSKRAMVWKPRLRTVLLLVNLAILLLPVGGIAVLRLYENELVQRTESELLVQGAFVVSIFEKEWRHPDAPADERPPVRESVLQPLLPVLDIAVETIRPRAPEPIAVDQVAEERARRAGRSIEPILRETKNKTLAGFRIVDRQGIIVASTGRDLGSSIAHWEEVGRALAGHRVSLLRERLSDEPRPRLESISRGKRVRVSVALPIESGGLIVGAVVLSRTPIDVMKALYLKRGYVWSGAAILLALVLLVSFFTSRRISRPVEALIRQTEGVARGGKSTVAPLAAPGTYEVDLLSKSIARMAETLEQRADYIRTFASHVSHEFKTPLTSIRGIVELFADHLEEMTREERGGFLKNLQEDAGRLEKLVRRLLDLARADMMRPGEERADVGAVMNRLALRRAKEVPAVKINAVEGLAVPMSEEVLETILSNLIDNARLHGGEAVQVTLEASRRGKSIAIVVADDGQGISSANAARIFTPFFTTAREKGGSGLGLSIVRSLVRAHGGEIVLATATRGARFEIDLPA